MSLAVAPEFVAHTKLIASLRELGFEPNHIREMIFTPQEITVIAYRLKDGSPYVDDATGDVATYTFRVPISWSS